MKVEWFNQQLSISAAIILFLHSMEQKTFSLILEHALTAVASEHQQQYTRGGAQAWAKTGASYLAFALCGLPQTELRRIQYETREQYGPVILDCKWYDQLKTECLNQNSSACVMLPGPDGTLCQCTLTQDLFLEMLDFCREG